MNTQQIIKTFLITKDGKINTKKVINTKKMPLTKWKDKHHIAYSMPKIGSIITIRYKNSMREQKLVVISCVYAVDDKQYFKAHPILRYTNKLVTGHQQSVLFNYMKAHHLNTNNFGYNKYAHTSRNKYKEPWLQSF